VLSALGCSLGTYFAPRYIYSTVLYCICIVLFEYATNQDGPTIVLSKDEAGEALEGEGVEQPIQLPGFQTVSILEPFSVKDLGPDLLPSETYGSDHIAIAADLQLFWYY
jgi:hypothetical protein